jgi:hypothetical protein
MEALRTYCLVPALPTRSVVSSKWTTAARVINVCWSSSRWSGPPRSGPVLCGRTRPRPWRRSGPRSAAHTVRPAHAGTPTGTPPTPADSVRTPGCWRCYPRSGVPRREPARRSSEPGASGTRSSSRAPTGTSVTWQARSTPSSNAPARSVPQPWHGPCGRCSTTQHLCRSATADAPPPAPACLPRWPFVEPLAGLAGRPRPGRSSVDGAIEELPLLREISRLIRSNSVRNASSSTAWPSSLAA